MISRRRVLAVSALAAVGTVAAGSSASGRARGVSAVAADPATATATPSAPVTTPPAPAAAARGVPRTIARVVRDGPSRVPRTEFGLSHLGVAWSGASPLVRVYTEDGWSSWRSLDDCGGAPDDHGQPGGLALLTVPGATGYEVSGGGAVSLTELNTVDGPTRVTASAVASGMPLPDGTICPVPYLSRAAWGADESLRFVNGVETWPAEFSRTQALTVHHSAGTNNDPNPAATVRAIYHSQAIGKGWGDIGYHLLIDEAGQVYEGRVSGGDATPVYGASDGKVAQVVTAGHVLGYNVGNIGICLLGDLTSRQPTAAARASLTTVLAALARLGTVNPLGTVNYVDPIGGNTRTVLGINGHRDWAATACPGNTFYPQLPSLRVAVAALQPAPKRVRDDQPAHQQPDPARQPSQPEPPSTTGPGGRQRP